MGLLCAEQNVRNLKNNKFSGILGLLCAEQDVGNLENALQEFWDSCAQNKTSEISKNALPRITGLMCAEEDVGNLKKWTFMNYETSVRRTKHRKSEKKRF